MGNLTDKINSMLRELQEVSDTINGVERRPVQVQNPQGVQPRIVYGNPNAGPGQQPRVAVRPVATSESINEQDLTAAAHAEANNPYRHVPHDAHDSSINPISLSAYAANPLMQGIILSEILGKPVSRRPRGLGRRV